MYPLQYNYKPRLLEVRVSLKACKHYNQGASFLFQYFCATSAGNSESSSPQKYCDSVAKQQLLDI